MRIKRLDLTGFKSFPERVQVPFAEGISAVVGPNGCGKSNIVDAIRWVMGEQSPKQLRGRNMEDVVFNGSRTLPQSGLAEVTMVLCNESGLGPRLSLGPSEISITRRLYRSGDSEYLINKVPCRLKDITQFFMDTGMGTKAYAIIEQGRIGALVDARPEERRALIDEAAGITRYKAQKREAERKIEATEQNLIHIQTVMAETKRQINSLTRAARKAARYKELKEELKEIDLALTTRELAAYSDQRALLETRKHELEADLSSVLNNLEKTELDLERTRLEILDQEKEAESKAKELYELQNEYNKLLQENEFLEKQDEENRNRSQRLSEELTRLAEQIKAKREESAHHRERQSVLKSELEERNLAHEEIRREVEEFKKEHAQSLEEQHSLNQRLAETRARTGRLEEILAGHERLMATQSARQEEIYTEVEQLEAESTRLTEENQAWEREKSELTEKREQSLRHCSELKEKQVVYQAELARIGSEERTLEARSAALNSRLSTLKDIQADFGWYPESVQALMAEEEMRAAGVIAPVAERISVPEGFDLAAEAALGDKLQFVLVKNRPCAVRAIEFLKGRGLGRCGFLSLSDLPGGAEKDLLKALLGEHILAGTMAEINETSFSSAVLTREGEYFGPEGVAVGGCLKDSDQGLLTRRREIKALEQEVQVLTDQQKQLADLRLEVLGQAETIASDLAGAEESAKTTQAAIVEIDKMLSASGGRLSGLQSRLAQAAASLEQLTVQARRLQDEKKTVQSEKLSLRDDEEILSLAAEKAAEKSAVLAAELETARERERETSLLLGSIGEQLKTTERELTRTNEWISEIETLTGGKKREQEEAGRNLIKINTRRQSISEVINGFQDQLDRAQNEVIRKKSMVDESRARQNDWENEARGSRRQRAQIDELVRQAELDLQEVGFKSQALGDRIQNDYQLDITALPPEARVMAEPDLDPEEAGLLRQELREKIKSLGEVNLTAIGEHDALLERYHFYKNQYDDLTTAVENLKKSIAKINRTCKIRFKSTFEAVDKKLREIFPLLFEGGEAWLSLTNENDPLDSGVEIHVHPPGKKLTVMSLLSGGEKALVALALIFALYLIKPSPFCLLDETDAPLDEANIDRFNRLLTRLGQSSQIIMVTHNKRTMQISHTLYGVTMEEPGVSKLVSVSLSDLEEFNQNAQMVVQAG